MEEHADLVESGRVALDLPLDLAADLGRALSRREHFDRQVGRTTIEALGICGGKAVRPHEGDVWSKDSVWAAEQAKPDLCPDSAETVASHVLPK